MRSKKVAPASPAKPTKRGASARPQAPGGAAVAEGVVHVPPDELAEALEFLFECITAWARPRPNATLLHRELNRALRKFCDFMRECDRELILRERPATRSEPEHGRMNTIRNSDVELLVHADALPAIVSALRRADEAADKVTIRNRALARELRSHLAESGVVRSEEECLQVIESLRSGDHLRKEGPKAKGITAPYLAAVRMGELLFDGRGSSRTRFSEAERNNTLEERRRITQLPLEYLLPVLFNAMGIRVWKTHALIRATGQVRGYTTSTAQTRRARIPPLRPAIDPATPLKRRLQLDPSDLVDEAATPPAD